MIKAYLCFATSTKTVASSGERKVKFPLKAVKKPVSAKATTEDTLRRYPRIMAELAK
jgi:hypothetical protein